MVEAAAPVLAAAASEADFRAARMQMALSLGWHIVIACFGVGMPALVLIAEWRGPRTGDPVYRLLARRWARAMGVLFAVAAVSGTNNAAEQAVRPVKIRQKISGCMRTMTGAQAFCALRSYLATGHQQGREALAILRQLHQGRPWLPAYGSG